MNFLIYGTVLTLVCMSLHAASCVILLRWLKGYVARYEVKEFSAAAYALSIATLLLFISHLVHVALWTLLFHLLDLFNDLETAFYFSFTSYTTVGYGDVVLAPPWRTLGSIAGADGYLMFGLSTAVLYAVLTNVLLAPLYQPVEAT